MHRNLATCLEQQHGAVLEAHTEFTFSSWVWLVAGRGAKMETSEACRVSIVHIKVSTW